MMPARITFLLFLCYITACTGETRSKKNTTPDQQIPIPDLGPSILPDAPLPVDLNLTPADLGDLTDAAPQLTNVNLCTEPKSTLFPLSGGEGVRAAARLTPAQYPFTLTALRYTVVNGGTNCTSAAPHKVEIFTSTSSVPEATPTVLETIAVPASTPPTGPDPFIVLQHTLQTPQVVNNGESLFISVELASDGAGKVLCMALCPENAVADRNYWSNAKNPPYPWVTLSSINKDANLIIEGFGSP